MRSCVPGQGGCGQSLQQHQHQQQQQQQCKAACHRPRQPQSGRAGQLTGTVLEPPAPVGCALSIRRPCMYATAACCLSS
jgi:hypothetical protein